MSVPLMLLGLLEREPSHGYDLKRDYDSYFGQGRPLPYSQGPERRRYAITEAGIEDVHAWLSEPGSTLDVLLADHSLYRLEADLRWIDHTAARLDVIAQAVSR